MSEEKKTYSLTEVCELLNVAESTVYSYARKGDIESAPNPYNVNPSARYIKSTVDAYIASQKAEQGIIQGKKIKELVEQLKIPRQRLVGLIEKHHIPVHKIVHKGRPLILIPEESAEDLEKIVAALPQKNKQAKSDFYLPSHDLALYQFVKDSEGKLCRVKRDFGIWGLEYETVNFETYFQPLFDVDGTLAVKVEAVYPIHKETFKSQGYAHFKVSEEETELYPWIDYFYTHFGIENLYIDDSEKDFISLYIKQHRLDLTLAPLPSAIEDFKEIALQEGDVVHILDELFIIPSTRRISAMISLTNYTQLKQIEETEHRELSDVLNGILTEYFKQNAPK